MKTDDIIHYYEEKIDPWMDKLRELENLDLPEEEKRRLEQDYTKQWTIASEALCDLIESNCPNVDL